MEIIKAVFLFANELLKIFVARGLSWFVGRATRGAAKPRGRGLGQRNIKNRPPTITCQ